MQNGIDINSSMNGVYLPGCKSSMSGFIHCGQHTEAYAQLIYTKLADAEKNGGRDAILRGLDDIRRKLLAGDILLNSRGAN